MLIMGDPVLTAASIIAIVCIINTLYYTSGENISKLSFMLVIGNSIFGPIFIAVYGWSFDIPISSMFADNVILYQLMIAAITFVIYITLSAKKRTYERQMEEWRRVSGEQD